jgi:hypothetical protein
VVDIILKIQEENTSQKYVRINQEKLQFVNKQYKSITRINHTPDVSCSGIIEVPTIEIVAKPTEDELDVGIVIFTVLDIID